MPRLCGSIRGGAATLLAAVLIASAVCYAQPCAAPTLEAEFKLRAIEHVRFLANLGNRVAGGEGESKAARYIRERMEKAGLEVAVEPFQFQSFALETATLKTGEEKAEILRLGFNPYSGNGSLAGELAFVESGADGRTVMKAELDDKIVATVEGTNFFLLALLKKPRAVVYLSRPDFDRLQAGGAPSAEIGYRGRMVKTNSTNVVGTLAAASGTGREIILSAHLDSWKGPGASDNASGVAVLLELARHYRALKPPPAVSMRFVAFGAEEMGMLGAKAYLARHQAELQNCELLFNIDTVGGGKAIVTETRGGIKGVSRKAESPLPEHLSDKAFSDLEGRWILLEPGLGPLFNSSNVPEWLRAAVQEAGKELGLEIVASSGMGSDHRVFVQAGIVATNIAVTGSKIHSADDVAESVSAESLEKAARIVAAVVNKTGCAAK